MTASSTVVAATITLARDPAEEALIHAALSALTATMPVFVSDGGSRAVFIDSIGRLPEVTIVAPRSHGLIGQIRASMDASLGTGAPFILYAESDKEAFFARELPSFLAGARCGNDVGVVIAARSEGSLHTYPDTQQITEATVNGLCARFSGGPGDYSYGPFLMNRELGKELEGVAADLGWGWRPYLFVRAARRGLRVLHVVGDHPCPADQRADDPQEQVHRLRQLEQNVRGIAAAIRAG